jgi:hypothetical protein
MKEMFRKLGIPQEVALDNGPQYSSRFAEEYDLTPLLPVRNILNSMDWQKKEPCTESQENLDKSKANRKNRSLGSLEYRTTPLNNGYSPSQLLIRFILSVVHDELRPKVPARVREMRWRKKNRKSITTAELSFYYHLQLD